MAELLQDDNPRQALEWLQRGFGAIAHLHDTDIQTQEAVQTQGEEAALYTRLGYVQLTLGNYAEALQAFDQALMRLPEGPSQLRARILGNQGAIYTGQAEVARGIACYRRRPCHQRTVQ